MMATHNIDTWGMVREARNGKEYVEFPAGRFQAGDVLEFHRPGKTGRRRMPALHLVFTIEGLGEPFEREYEQEDAERDGRRVFTKVYQRYYGVHTQTVEGAE